MKSKETKRAEAEARNKLYQALSPSERLQRTNTRLGIDAVYAPLVVDNKLTEAGEVAWRMGIIAEDTRSCMIVDVLDANGLPCTITHFKGIDEYAIE